MFQCRFYENYDSKNKFSRLESKLFYSLNNILFRILYIPWRIILFFYIFNIWQKCPSLLKLSVYGLFNINHVYCFGVWFLVHLFCQYFRNNPHTFQSYIKCHRKHCFLKSQYWFHKDRKCKLSFKIPRVSFDVRSDIYLFSKVVFGIKHKTKHYRIPCI